MNGIDSFFHPDWLGSTRDLTDDTGNTLTHALRYDAFGNRVATGGSYDPTPFQFAGDWGYQSEGATSAEDGPGLQYLTNRYYDPAVGRFISADPLGFLPGANLYRYVGNDPVNWVDPLGLDAENAEPGWAQGLENGFATVGALVGGLGGGGLGGGGGFLAGVAGGPAALLTGGAGAAEGWALGTAGGYAAGRGLGRGIAGGIQFLAARGHGGGGKGRGGRPPQSGSACPPPGGRSFKGLVGKAFENALREHLGAEEFPPVRLSTGERVEFDGRITATDWFEAKSGGTWQRLLGSKEALSEFMSDIGEEQKAAAEHGASFQLFTNTPIPRSIKQWLTQRGVPFTELLD